VLLIEPTVFGDSRGYFVETFRQDLFEKKVGYKVNFIQDNESKSTKGVLRGLHYQLPPYTQSKLVRVIKGSVLDVAVDMRKNSPTFGQHVDIELTEQNKHQLFVPRGFAHGFVVLSDIAIFAYKVDNYYSPEYERGIAYDDNNLAINWRLPKENLLLSDKDKINPNIKITKDLFE
jgi:dTDP-4-dehydrorhamnose 3,5-epimerase